MKYLPVNFLLIELFKFGIKRYQSSKKNMKKPLLSLIIPTYNEAENIPELLKRLAGTLKGLPHEIIIVDDDSPDSSWKIAQELSQKEYPQLHVLRRLNARGLSSAVLSGMAMAKGEVFAVMDADLQHDESILPNMFSYVREKGYDIVVASRGLAEGSYGDFSFLRRMMSGMAAFVSKLFLPMPLTDPMSGFFAIKRELYDKKVDRINPLGFKILVEFIGHSPEVRVTEVPYTFRTRAHGKTKLGAGVVRHFFMALWNLRFGHLVSANFMLYAGVGFIGIFINLAGFALGEFLALPRIDTGLFPAIDPIWVSVPFGVELSIISNYFLNNYISFYETRRIGLSSHLRGFFIFQLISLLGLLIQWSIFQLLYTNNFLLYFWDSMDSSLAKYIYNFIGILAATASNYHLNLSYTWKKV